MKVARWVREETVGKGLSPGNHLKHQAGQDSISTSLAVYFMSQESRPARRVGKASRRAKGDRMRIPRGKVRGMRIAISEREVLTRRAGYRETGMSGSGRDGWKRVARHLASRLLRVTHGLKHRIKYARLIQRPASSPRAAGADAQGSRYVVQLALEGKPHHKPKHSIGTGTVGGDLGPSTLALVPQEGEASLQVFCAELAPDAKAIRRLQRQMERQRRAANPEQYDEKGRIKKQGNKKLQWKHSKRYQATRRRKATKERKLAAHRKSLHGRKVHEVVALGSTIIIEKISYKAWQKLFGKSVGLRAPGMFVDLLRRTVASTGGTLVEVPTRTTALSQWCHGCGKKVKKPLSQRWHLCACGIGPVQRDLYSAFLAAYLDPANPTPSCARYQRYWEGAEARLRAAHERTTQRAKEGQALPRSFGIPRAGARLPKSPGEPTLEPALLLRRGRLEAWKERSEPPLL
ncbi:transposase [Ktedonobacter racemifer]|uniref:Transposase IS605 OrfB n=1 Tax=Ktedonobacter racemifer DSM 44963 TaxID=485913 RepID=D6TD03_KTERA|nr:transposase [Ktedonobacter racemifer]EFH90054.1 transposase IS605 OrfB [Ktedonobacter racemifer DSM 44963]